jgi:hypothetical protein
MYKARTGAGMKDCIENGLDDAIYRLGRHRIKKMIQRKHGMGRPLWLKRIGLALGLSVPVPFGQRSYRCSDFNS